MLTCNTKQEPEGENVQDSIQNQPRNMTVISENARLQTTNIPLWLSQCDVSNEQQVEATVTGAVQHFGTIDIIVNNAGLMIFKKLEEHTGEDWSRILNVDLMGAFYFTKHAFLTMKDGGCIINISTGAGDGKIRASRIDGSKRYVSSRRQT